MADEKQKLGPSVTYSGNDPEDKQAVTINDVRFKPGEAVNLVDRLGEARAKPVLEKLAGNPFFKVDGGPDHAAEKKKREEAAQKEEEARLKDQEEEAKAKAEEAGSSPRKSGQAEQAKADREKQGKMNELPADSSYQPPESEGVMEKPSRTAVTEGGATNKAAKK